MVDPNETEADRSKRERFQCYRTGFRDGILRKTQDKRFTEHKRREVWEAYGRGYSAGEDAWLVESCRECERLGYNPQFKILREQPVTKDLLSGCKTP